MATEPAAVTWKKTPADRQRDRQVYEDPEYRRNKRLALRRAGGRCENCGQKRQVQVDHRIPVTQGGTHALANLQVLCCGPGSCHGRKTATEGRGYRGSKGRTDPEPRTGTAW